MIDFIGLLAVLAVIVLGSEVLARTTRLPLELTRKLTHILAGTAVALAAFVMPHVYLVIISVMFIAVIAFSRSRGLFRSIHDAERGGLGELWYPLGILLAALLFSEPPVFAYAVLVLAVSDGLAGLVGKLFGKTKVGFISEPKTYLGSAVFAVSAALLSLTVLPPQYALPAGLYLALIELLGFRGLDNLVLPLAAGVIALVFA